MASCIPSESLKPFAIITAGIFVEYWIVTLISSSTTTKDKSSKVETKLAQTIDQEAGNPPSSQDKEASDGETPSTTAVSFKCITSRCIATFKLILRIWQIVSAVTILVLDIMQLVDYVKANPDESGWSHYSCYVQIAINSANFKTTFVNLYMISIYDHVTGGRKGDLFSFIWVIVVVMLFSLIVPIGITHGFVSVCYVWIMLGTLCATACLTHCMFACFAACPALGKPLSCFLGFNVSAWDTSMEKKTKKIEKEHEARNANDGKEGAGADETETGADVEKGTEADKDDGTEADEDEGWGDIMNHSGNATSPIAMALEIVLMFMVPLLSTNYWLSGSYSYMGSLEHVLTERSIRVYFNNISTQFSSSFRFLATIL